jgi:hypothetical protein
LSLRVQGFRNSSGNLAMFAAIRRASSRVSSFCLLAATAVSFLVGVFPAFAQSGGGCADWCRVNRCSGGYTSGAAPKCMMACIDACQKKSKSKK